MCEDDDGARGGEVGEKEEGESGHRDGSEFSKIDTSLRSVLDLVNLGRYVNDVQWMACQFGI
jgi:hypothetical protein